MTTRALVSLDLAASVLFLAACGGDDDSPTADDILNGALADLRPFQPVDIDTEVLASAVRAGDRVVVPFVLEDNALSSAAIRLTLRNLRHESLTQAYVKNDPDDSFEALTLPPPATYQGVVEGQPGVAVATVTDDVFEANILMAPEGWSIVEPIEPLLRAHGVDQDQIDLVLATYDHIAYNTREASADFDVDADLYPNPGLPILQAPAELETLTYSVVADGDDAFHDAYPPDSVMPFWLKQETMFNVVDWLFNCIEPDSNEDNAYAYCANDFDGGSDGFQAKVRLDRLEVWEAGGPNSTDRDVLLHESTEATHQADPPCCGPPHTAGRSALVYFFSGRTLTPGAGVASVRGLDVYGESCFLDGMDYVCHHALSQMTPGHEFPGSAYYQELLVAHEIGHVNGGEEQSNPFAVCWLFEEQCGTNLMGSIAFNGPTVYHFTERDSRQVMGPLMHERLGTMARLHAAQVRK